MPVCNSTLEDSKIVEDPIWKEVTFHELGLVISAVFALIAVITAFVLIFRHATHYLRPYEQRHIIRILLMVPIYALVSFLSYFYYTHSVYFEVIRDCYEAFAIASFFTLLCNYIAPTLHDQKEYFRHTTPKNWMPPLNWFQRCSVGRRNRKKYPDDGQPRPDRSSIGTFRKPRSGLTWFNIMWIGIFQYCFVRVLFTIVSVVSEHFDRYCESSLSPAFAHLWVMIFESTSVTVAMYCLIQFYVQLKEDLASHRPFMKVMCIKLVIFFCFWQDILISFLVSSGTLSPSKQLAYEDINLGIPSMLLCIEMAIFAILHLYAFPWAPYDKSKIVVDEGRGEVYQGGRFGLKALLDAFNPWDIIKASARGFRWLFVGVKKRTQDKSYHMADATKPGEAPSPTEYTGITFAATGEPATETSLGVAAAQGVSLGGLSRSRGRADTDPDDRAGLLSNAQPAAHGWGDRSPSRERGDSEVSGSSFEDVGMDGSSYGRVSPAAAAAVVVPPRVPVGGRVQQLQMQTQMYPPQQPPHPHPHTAPYPENTDPFASPVEGASPSERERLNWDVWAGSAGPVPGPGRGPAVQLGGRGQRLPHAPPPPEGGGR